MNQFLMDNEEDDVITITIEDNDHQKFKRLDVFLTRKINSLSRNFIKSLFQKGLITSSKSSPYQGKLELKKLPPVGSILCIDVPPPAPSNAVAQNIPLDILFEDEHLIVINKRVGMVVHPAPGHPDGTLVNAILHHCSDLSGVGDQKRPGIVHRLDKGTSGVMVVAKNQQCHEGLVLLFSSHDIKREYLAIVMNTKLPSKGEVDSPIGRHPHHRLKMSSENKRGKRAKTYWSIVQCFKSCSLISCTLETGRTHQIRVHMAQNMNSPLLMDPLYGSPKDHLNRVSPQIKKHLKEYPHPLLHAKKLGFIHPITKESLEFIMPPPSFYQKTLDFLEKEI